MKDILDYAPPGKNPKRKRKNLDLGSGSQGTLSRFGYVIAGLGAAICAFMLFALFMGSDGLEGPEEIAIFFLLVVAVGVVTILGGLALTHID